MIKEQPNIHFGRYYGTFYRKTASFMREALRPLGLTFSEGIMLILVSENPGTIQEGLAQHLSIDKAVAARSLKHLEKLGLIERRDDPHNQRVKKVFPTKAAREPKKRLDQIMSYWNQAILEGFSATDRKTIILAFQHMRTRALALDIKQCVAEIYST